MLCLLNVQFQGFKICNKDVPPYFILVSAVKLFMHPLIEWQIDELVVQAFRLKTASKEGRKEIKSFSLVLSDMLSSLKVKVSLASALRFLLE